MSAKVMGQVYDLDLPSNEQAVLLALADHADHDGNNVFPSNGLVAWKLGMSTDTVSRLKQRLEARKILVLIDAPAGDCKVYRVDIAAGTPKQPYRTKRNLQPPASCGPPQVAAPSKAVRQGVPQSCAAGGTAKLCGPNHQEPSKEPKESEIPSNLRIPEFEEVWKEWLADRKERKKPVTHRAATLQLQKLSGWGPPKAIQAIRNAIEGGWQGLFEPKNEINQRNNKQPVNRSAGTFNEKRLGQYAHIKNWNC